MIRLSSPASSASRWSQLSTETHTVIESSSPQMTRRQNTASKSPAANLPNSRRGTPVTTKLRNWFRRRSFPPRREVVHTDIQFDTVPETCPLDDVDHDLFAYNYEAEEHSTRTRGRRRSSSLHIKSTAQLNNDFSEANGYSEIDEVAPLKPRTPVGPRRRKSSMFPGRPSDEALDEMYVRSELIRRRKVMQRAKESSRLASVSSVNPEDSNEAKDEEPATEEEQGYAMVVDAPPLPSRLSK